MSDINDTADCTTSWKAPYANHQLKAFIEVPGSKSLSNRYLILAAIGTKPVVLQGLLRSRDTELMINALSVFGVRSESLNNDGTKLRVIPPEDGIFRVPDNAEVYCGLAGTVMRFVTALALFADKAVRFDGDKQAYARPMKPVLDGLEQLGARVEYHGEEGFLPFTITPQANESRINDFSEKVVQIDSSSSSQFISALLLIGSRIPGGLSLKHTGSTLPSMPHIRMTMDDICKAGGIVNMTSNAIWHVKESKIALADTVTIEPDLSNAAPFLGSALINGGSVSIPNWPLSTTQPGGLLPGILEKMGAKVNFEKTSDDAGIMHVESDGAIKAIPYLDLSAAGEIAPSIAAILAFADGSSELHGIAHLRGHETNRLQALVNELNRVGIGAKELEDGIRIEPNNHMHGEVMETYADHRMATFAAMLGLRITGIYVKNIETTRKTIPDFPRMWHKMLE
ncbi:3-phosphoshikimate 1-carboxyvinyltransferase [Gardnerella vaginalis]|uniref:3-phosphoshikimate 1-carboxyvinyltransferase n=1 Tax=Gardnerella vaginalis TaxID=2702 RepID=UPI0039EE4542